MGDWTDLLPRAGQGSGIPEAILAQQQGRAQIGAQNAQTQVLGAQFQALQAKAARKQEFDRRVAAVTSETNPSRQTKLISDLLMEFPEEKDAIKAGWDVKDEGAKRADLGWLGETVAAFDANRPDLALASLQRRRAADAAAGLDTSTDDSWIDAVKSNDKKAIAYVRGAMLGHIGAVDPDRFAQNYKTAAEPGSPFTLSPGQERRDPITGEVTAKAAFAPRVIPVTQPDGSVKYVEYQPGGGDLGSVAPGGSPVPSGDVVARMLPITIKSEGGGTLANPAVSPKGARGPMQVMPGTNASPGFGVTPAKDSSEEERARVGRDYLSAMVKRYGDPAKAWAAYNAGPGAVDDAVSAKGAGWLTAMPAETRKYVAKNMTALNGGAALAPQTGPVALPGGARVVAVGAPKAPKPTGQRMTPEEVAAEGLDPNMVYYRGTDGIPRAVSGQTRPNAQAKPWPAKTLDARITNDASIENIDSALKLLNPKNNTPEAKAARSGVGFGTGALGEQFTNYNDPQGTPIRALIGQIGGIIIKDISGAAVSVAEDARLSKWVPKVTDSPQVITFKIQNLKREIALRNSVMDRVGKSQGYRPFAQENGAPASRAAPAAGWGRAVKVQ